MLEAMERLRVDEGIRGLIRQMWKHCYKIDGSCQGGGDGSLSGHGMLAYVLFEKDSGDDWFEENAEKYGLKKVKNKSCCRYKANRKTKSGKKVCGCCGAGIYGYVIYEGEEIKNFYLF